MTASIVNKTFKSIVAASAALIMAASVAGCVVRGHSERRRLHG